jgi:tRNA threonylcarbamoyladenosine biosynthesis protein TsaE
LKNQLRTVDLIAADHHLPIVKTIAWRNEGDTAAFAAQLARRFGGHSALRHAFLELQGDLGAGKTTFVRHLLRALGVQGRIKSPTYAVVEPHEVPGLNIWHFDFYRFADPREWEDAGFRDIFASPGLKIAEWPEKAAALLPKADLLIAITAQADESRDVVLTAQTAIGAELLA